MLRVSSKRDLIGGIILTLFGLFVALYAASHYEIGSLASMGPGFFPILLGWILAGLGALVTLLSFRITLHAVPAPQLALRPFFAILSATAVFALLVEHIGLLLTAVCVVIIAAWANREFNLRRALLLGLALAGLSWLIFVLALKLTIPVLPI